MTEQISIEEDITVGYITARAFPEGVLEAHQKLHAIVPFDPEKRYFGISRPENGTIIYRAAVELKSEESGRLELDFMTLKKGEYIRQKIEHFRQDISSIGRTFEQLLQRSDLDPQGYCVELYDKEGDDVWCMIRLDQTDSARVEVAVDCGNSPKMQFLKDFNIAFARADIAALSAAVTEDIRWNMVGDQLIEGKAGFTAALREMSGEKPKAMSISKVVTHGKAGAVNGQLIMQNGKKYAFCDVYEFKSVKGDRIASIDSYVIELKP